MNLDFFRTRTHASFATAGALLLSLTLSLMHAAPAGAQPRPILEPTQTSGTTIDLIVSPAKTATAASLKKASPSETRARAVGLNLSALRAAIGDAATLRLALFDDTALTVQIREAQSTASGGTAYVGHVPGVPHSIAIMVDNGGVVAMRVNTPERSYSVQGSPRAGYVVREQLPFDLPDAPLPSRRTVPEIAKGGLPPVAAANTASGGGVRAAAATGPDTGDVVDVMVLYTPAAKLQNGGAAQIAANIDAEIALTNTIYAQSNVVQRLRLVYQGEIAYAGHPVMSTDLQRLTLAGGGFMDEALSLRNVYAADLVSLWGVYETGQGCGVGWVMENENAGFETQGYSVVNSPVCTGGSSYTLAHELGHNMGLKHDNFQSGQQNESPNNTVTAEGTGATATIAYAHGYIDLANRFRTVMSYDQQCVNAGYSCSRIPYFSNPAISYDNHGYYGGATPATTGNAANAYERQALNDTRETVANFRAGRTSFTGPGVLLFTPPNYVVDESGGTVTLTVSRHLGSSGAISVAYATTDGTATGGADYTAANGILSWADGETGAKTITVGILQDTQVEGRETFSVMLSNATGGASIGSVGGNSAAATVAIADDEPDPFPPGAVLPADYVTPGGSSGAWSMDLADGYLTPTSLRSAATLGNGNPTQPTAWTYVNSDLEYTGNFTAGNVGFAYKVSSYSDSYGVLEFMIDGVVAFTSAGGETGWRTTSQAISAGNHTLRWRFKNKLPFACGTASPPPPGGSACADRAWIDTVTLPLVGRTLSILKGGTGAGTVTGNGIDCGADCTETVAAGTTISLTAAPAAGSLFTGWSGGGCAGTGGCSVTLSSSQNVTATFDRIPEAFPGNCAIPQGWIKPAAATAGWTVATDRMRNGDCSLKSEPMGNAAEPGTANANKAQIQVSGNFNAGTLSFYYNVSSEAGYDCLRLIVDGAERSEMGNCFATDGNGGFGATGEVSAWTQVAIPISAGNHTIVWSYEKDNVFSSGADAGWIDDVTLPTLAGTSGSVQFSTATLAVSEGVGNAVLNVFRTGGTAGAASVDYATAAGSAIAGTDFTAVNGTLTWGDGDGAGKSISIPILNDGTAEASKSFTVTLSGAVGATLGAPVTATVSIADDDAATAPGAPTIGSAIPGNSQATISFAPPAANGGSAITGYTMSCNPGAISTGGTSSPIVMTGLTNGTTYTCAVTASNAVGTGPASGTVNVTPSAAPPLTLVSVHSRKSHGGTPRDVALNHTIPLTGPVSVEPRGGPDHVLVFAFNDTVTAPGTPAATDGVTSIGSPTILGVSSNEIQVGLFGVPDNVRATVSLAGVNGTLTASASLGFLHGDVNGSGSITASDIAAIKAQMNQPASATNFKMDLNATGSVSANDLNAVRARAGVVLRGG